MEREVVIYTKDDCKYCRMLKRFMQLNNYDYEEVTVKPDSEEKQFLADNGRTTVPVLQVDGELVEHEPYENIHKYFKDEDDNPKLKVIKRNKQTDEFDENKIFGAIQKANRETLEMDDSDIEKIVANVVSVLKSGLKDGELMVDVESIQDEVEESLMLGNFTKTAKAYIIYRDKQAEKRKRDIFKPRLNFKPYEYPELEKYKEAIQHSYWLFSEFNYTSDVHDYRINVKPHERNAIKNAMLAISQVEVDVKTFWGDLYKHLPKPEFANVGSTFAESEVRHSDAYANLLELLGLNKEFENIEKIPALMNRIKYLKKHLDYVNTGDKRDYAISVLLFSAAVEHISLFSQFLIIMSFNKHKNLFSGTSNAIEATSKEEQLHGEFGIELVNTIKEENPDWFDEQMQEDVYEMFNEAYEAELKLLDWIFEDGELDFLPKLTVEEFIKNRLNNSLEAIGLERIFEVDEEEVVKSDWFDDEVVATKHNDFFNKRSVNYTKRAKSITSNDLF